VVAQNIEDQNAEIAIKYCRNREENLSILIRLLNILALFAKEMKKRVQVKADKKVERGA
jgi:hypothetical protein